nr:MAG TPA: hypothetical protein [Caudoviricetes sp.]
MCVTCNLYRCAVTTLQRYAQIEQAPNVLCTN